MQWIFLFLGPIGGLKFYIINSYKLLDRNNRIPSIKILLICKKRNLTFLLNMAVNCSLILLKISWMAVELPTKVEAI